MIKTSTIVLLVSFLANLLLGIFLYKCLNREVEEKIVYKTTTEVDTVWAEKIVRVPVLKHDTTVVIDTVHITGQDMYIKKYTNVIEDTLIEGSVTTTVFGEMLNQELRYTPLFPTTITKTITNDITRTITKRKSYFQLGVAAQVKDELSLNPMAGFTTRRGKTIFYGYNPLDKSHIGGILLPLN